MKKKKKTTNGGRCSFSSTAPGRGVSPLGQGPGWLLHLGCGLSGAAVTIPTWESPRITGPVLSVRIKKDHSVLGSILGPLIFGNYRPKRPMRIFMAGYGTSYAESLALRTLPFRVLDPLGSCDCLGSLGACLWPSGAFFCDAQFEM